MDNFDNVKISPNMFEVYLINLGKNKDRLDEFIKQYKESDMHFKSLFRYEAVDGNIINIEDYVSPLAFKEIVDAEENGYRLKHYQLTRGAVGCYLSHYNIYKIIRDGDAKFGFIFEDDAILDPKLYEKLSARILDIPNDWDILLLGCKCISCDNYETYANTQHFFYLHGYIVTKSGAAKICSYLDKILIEQQIDTVLSSMAKKGILRIYCLYDNPLARQNWQLQTTIQLPMKFVDGINPYEML